MPPRPAPPVARFEEARGAVLLAAWRSRWAAGRDEPARRIARIERCLDALSGVSPPASRLTIFAAEDDAMSVAG